jgi:hypothetical protein
MARSTALAKTFAATGPEQLALLIDAWRDQPAPALATRIDVVSERLAAGGSTSKGTPGGVRHNLHKLTLFFAG